MGNMTIVAYSDEKFSDTVPDGVYELMLNPDKLQWGRSIQYNEEAAVDSSGPSSKYSKTQSEKLSFELVIDCTGVVDAKRVDLPAEIRQLSRVIYDYNGKIHRPNYIVVNWGSGLAFKCVLTSFSLSYTFFKPNGTPLRAKASLEFASYTDLDTLARKEKKESPDMSHLITVVAGDSLPQIAHEIYRSPKHYVHIARAIPGSFALHGLRIEQTINRIATATLSFLDGDASSESFAISASASFVPGNEVSIELGYDGRNTPVFAGIVTKQVIRVGNAEGPLLEIECKDKAVKMTVGRNSANFADTTDSAVLGTLIRNACLSAMVSATSVQLPTLVQYYASDWDFMLARAEVNGMVVSTRNNTVSVFDPTASTASALTLTYGSNILSFHAELNALSQLAQVKASAWSFQSQQLISAQADSTLAGPGNLSSKQLAEVAGLGSYQMQTTATETNDELMTWAKAQMLKSALSKITGEARFLGAVVTPGQYLTLAGMGARFDGDHFISSVRHEVADGNWTTETNLGMSAIWFTQEHAVEAPSASGLLPGIEGLFNAKVKKISDDPDAEFRILVEVALFDANATGVWARLILTTTLMFFPDTAGGGDALLIVFLPLLGYLLACAILVPCLAYLAYQRWKRRVHPPAVQRRLIWAVVIVVAGPPKKA